MLNSFSVLAGGISGTVIDEGTGTPLPGVTVLVTGTSTGAATDMDGYFFIDGLEDGVYDIKVSYISYQDQIIRGVVVKDKTTDIATIVMKEATDVLVEVVIEAKALRNTQSALMTVQRKSLNVLDGISKEQFKLMGDNNAASAIRRVTGVSVENGKYVYVRGLSDRYTNTVINGAQVPGLDPNRNTVQMDLFPSSLVDNMVVYKTFTPNLPGNFTGGYIDIGTRDFTEDLSVNASFGLGYNPQANLSTDFLDYEGGSMDFLAMSDGNSRTLPNLSALPTYGTALGRDVAANTAY